MSKETASESQLAELHLKLAEVMKSSLSSYDRLEEITDELESIVSKGVKDADREQVILLIRMLPNVSPALMAVVAKFLKDNNITCAADNSEDLSSLEKRLALKKKRVGNVTHLDTEED